MANKPSDSYMCASNSKACNGGCKQQHLHRVRFKGDEKRQFNLCPSAYKVKEKAKNEGRKQRVTS